VGYISQHTSQNILYQRLNSILQDGIIIFRETTWKANGEEKAGEDRGTLLFNHPQSQHSVLLEHSGTLIH
jgi:hypothetical protein